MIVHLLKWVVSMKKRPMKRYIVDYSADDMSVKEINWNSRYHYNMTYSYEDPMEVVEYIEVITSITEHCKNRQHQYDWTAHASE